MDRSSSVVLARRYAQAYLNVYEHELTDSVRENIKALRDFLGLNSRIVFFLMVPSIAEEVKVRGIAFLGEKFELPKGLQKSMHILLQSKRACLLGRFFDFIDILYQKKYGRVSFVVSSSHEIASQDKEILQNFLKKLVSLEKCADRADYDILCTYKIDKKLIAGIRMQSNTHVWEHSIAKQLRSVQWLTVR